MEHKIQIDGVMILIKTDKPSDVVVTVKSGTTRLSITR